MLNELYQELIIDHGTDPRNLRKIENCTSDSNGVNPLCGDKVHVYVLLEKNTIKDISFEGSGCAISMASASIMTETLIGKNIKEAKEIFSKFIELVTKPIGSDEVSFEELDKLNALAGVNQYPTRVKCATLAWHTLTAAINNNQEIVSTE